MAARTASQAVHRHSAAETDASALAMAGSSITEFETSSPLPGTRPEARSEKPSAKAERRRSMPVPTLLPSSSLLSDPRHAPRSPPSATSLKPHRHSRNILSPPLTPRSPPRAARRDPPPSHAQASRSRDLAPAPNDPNVSISVHHLRSMSGLSLHTNSAVLRQYTDYNLDGSSRLISPSISESGDAPRSNGSAPDHRLVLPSAVAPPSVAGLYSPDTVHAVLRDQAARTRLLAFAKGRGSAKHLDFLDKVDEYSRAVHGITALIATISTTFTSVTATDSLNLPPPLAKAVNTDVKHVSSSILPGLEMLFGEAAAFAEQLIIRDIYPAFVAQQISMCLRASLGATSAAAAQTPFRFAGLGHAFCLADPSRPDGPVLYASDSFAQTIGYASAENIPRTGRVLCRPHHDGDGDEFVQEMVLNRNHRDGQPYWGLVSVCPLKAARGRVRFMLSTVVNVSDTIKTRSDVLQALSMWPVSSALAGNGGGDDDSDGNRSQIGSRHGPRAVGPTLSLIPPLRPTSAVSTSPSSQGHSPIPRHNNERPDSRSRFDRVFGPASSASQSSARRMASTKSFFNPFSRSRNASPSTGTSSTPDSRPRPRSTIILSAATSLEPQDVATQEPQPAPLKPGAAVGAAAPHDDGLGMYSRFMVMQFVPGSDAGSGAAAAKAPPPLSRRGSRTASRAPAPAASGARTTARLKVAFCSRPMLDLIGLGPAAQDAVLYHDVFSVLSELAGSPSITPIFREAVRRRLAAAEPASLEFSVPASGVLPPGAFSAGLGTALATPAANATSAAACDEPSSSSTKSRGSRRSKMFSFGRSKQDHDTDDVHGGGSGRHSSRRPGSSHLDRPVSNSGTDGGGQQQDPTKMQRLMSHWTPLKDNDGSVAWVVLVVSPVVER